MDSKPKIRKVQVKRILGNGWEMATVQEMTYDEAIREASKIAKEDDNIFAVKISRMTALSRWTEEFSGDKWFDYIGVTL